GLADFGAWQVEGGCEAGSDNPPRHHRALEGRLVEAGPEHERAGGAALHAGDGRGLQPELRSARKGLRTQAGALSPPLSLIDLHRRSVRRGGYTGLSWSGLAGTRSR